LGKKKTGGGKNGIGENIEVESGSGINYRMRIGVRFRVPVLGEAA